MVDSPFRIVQLGDAQFRVEYWVKPVLIVGFWPFGRPYERHPLLFRFWPYKIAREGYWKCFKRKPLPGEREWPMWREFESQQAAQQWLHDFRKYPIVVKENA